MSSEQCCVDVVGVHLDLMVSGTEINLGKYGRSLKFRQQVFD